MPGHYGNKKTQTAAADHAANSKSSNKQAKLNALVAEKMKRKKVKARKKYNA